MADIVVARVYDDPSPSGSKVLVDRLWPRGLRKNGAPFDEWCKDVAPSTDLRKWYGHDPARFREFRRRYLVELQRPPASEVLDQLRQRGSLVLLTATKDIEHSAAAVLSEVLRSDH
jgi:uncharacterized protein YeaO (DUF488 family)